MHNRSFCLQTVGIVRMDSLQDVAYVEKVFIVDGQGTISMASIDMTGDNLGNHTCTQNLKLGNYWLSNDGKNCG